MIATGRLCPVITASKSAEETEKRIGSVLLSGTPIVSLDNCTHDLGGELLCQLTERPVVKIRILGRIARCPTVNAVPQCSRPATTSRSKATWSGAASSAISRR